MKIQNLPAILGALFVAISGAIAPTLNAAAPSAPPAKPSRPATSPLTSEPRQPSSGQPSSRRDRPKQTLADGRKVIASELKVTLKESSARSLSRDAAGTNRTVSSDELRALHRDIAAIEGRHTAARAWLKGEPIPTHLRKDGTVIPRIARNFSVILRPGADVEAVRTELQQHPQVERVDYNEITSVHALPNDADFAQQWAPPVVGLPGAWDVPGRGRVRVAVIDTGAQLSHPEFAGRIVFENGYADLDDGEAPGSGSRFDHGTHVAGIIGAARDNGIGVAGYSNGIDLMILNCANWDDDAAEWKISDADDAMDDAVANGARIINCSFGFSDSIEDEVEAAYDAHVLVVHSAGNDATSIADHWESGSIALFTVTATMSSGAPVTDVFDAGYSSFGPGVDLAAPGTAIWSTVPVGMQQTYCNSATLAPAGYACKSGTSMAAPQVSGAAALLLSLNPTLIGDISARDLLIRMAEDKGAPGYDEQYGSGVLRLRRPTLQACRDADTFVSSASGAPEGGTYDWPWRTLSAAFDHVPDGSTLVLNAGVEDVAEYRYPAMTIGKPCTLSAIPDRPVHFGK